jgi:hypothetical protein
MKAKKADSPDFVKGLGDSSRRTIELGVLAVNDDPELFREVVELSFTQPYPANMRTARVAQLCCESNPSLILPVLDEIIERMSQSKNDGVKRSYLKVIDDYTGINDIVDPGLLMQSCFDWLMSPSEAISIRYHALGVLIQIAEKYPEMKSELVSLLGFILEQEPVSKGLANFIRKSMIRLKKN